jgi:branched-chain amino acid transport system permease protein
MKVLVFAISAFFAGIAGGIFAQYIGSLNPTMAGWLNSINYVIMVVFGGMGSITGSIVSAIGLTILPELLRAFADYRMLVYSVALVLVMIFRPQGIFGSWEFSLTKVVNRIFYRKKDTNDSAGPGQESAAITNAQDDSYIGQVQAAQSDIDHSDNAVTMTANADSARQHVQTQASRNVQGGLA